MLSNPLEFCTYVDNEGNVKFLTDFIPQVIAAYEMELRRNLDGNFPGAVYNAMETALIRHILTPVLASTPATDQPDDCRSAFERDTGLGWDQEGAEYARDHFVGGWQAARATERESVEDKLHELILRLARACDCATIVSSGSEDDKMLMLCIVEQVRENIVRHTQIHGFVEIWLAKEFPERYQLENLDEQGRRG